MQLTTRLKIAFLFLVLLIAAGSCHKNGPTSWNTQLLVPIATTTLSLQNLVSDSSIKKNADSSLTLSYQTSLYAFNLADQIVKIPDTSIGQKFTLDSLTLPQSHVTYVTTLGALADNMLTNPNTAGFGTLIINLQGATTTIPATPAFSSPPNLFDASSFFDSAWVTSAQIQLNIINKLPIAFNPGSILTLTNATNNTQVVPPYTITSGVPANGRLQVIINIPTQPGVDSVFITNKLLFQITNLSSPGSSTPVLVDSMDSVILDVYLVNMHVSQAWAKFPSQGVVDQTGDLTVPIGDRKFTYIDARSGLLHVYITNSVPQPLYLQYTLVGAFNKAGQPLNVFTTVPAAINGPQTVDQLIDISGYSINLTGQNGSSFNTYTQRVVARINYTGLTEHITLADSLNIRYELKNIAPNYIKGYAGRDTITANDSTGFSFLNIFKSGTIDLQSVNLSFNIVNGIGVDGQVRINSLRAENTQTNAHASLYAPTVLGKPLTINRATDYPLTPAVNNFTFNNNNSTVTSLLNILPNKLYYDAQVRTNVNGNTGLYRDFAYLQSNLTINLDAEVPLSLIANHLLLKDTIGFNLSNTNTNVNGISDGIINVITENKYPIQAMLTMVIYDGNWNPVDTLMMNQPVNAAALDNSCRARQPMQTVVQVTVNQARMNRIKQGQNAIITADFSTNSSNMVCNGQHLKIYSDYTIGITLSAKFNYKVNGKL